LIELRIDGKRIPMNKYVRDVFYKILLALVSTLKGIPNDWQEIELKVKREEDEK